MKIIMLVLGLCWTTFLPASEEKKTLEIGDKAKPLTGQWLKGTPLDPAKPDGKTIYILEFFDTGCGYCLQAVPMLNEMQKKYESIRIIGITEESEDQVRAFLANTEVGYSILQTGNEIIETYCGPEWSVPHLVIIDRQGIVSWTGYPQHRFSNVLSQMISGTYDLDKEKKILVKEAKLNEMYPDGRTEKDLLKIVDELISLDPAYFNYYGIKLEILENLNEPLKLKDLHQLMLRTFRDSVPDLVSLAQLLMKRSYENVNLDIAWEAVSRAVKLSRRKSGRALLAYARLLFMVGLVDEAITVLEEATQLDSPAFEEAVFELEFYRKVKAIRAKIKKQSSLIIKN